MLGSTASSLAEGLHESSADLNTTADDLVEMEQTLTGNFTSMLVDLKESFETIATMEDQTLDLLEVAPSPP